MKIISRFLGPNNYDYLDYISCGIIGNKNNKVVYI